MDWHTGHEPPPTSTTEVPGSELGRTVLVADQHPALRGPLAERLRALGYHVVEAGDGFEFLEYLSDLLAGEIEGESAELIVCDVQMPGASSLASLASVRPSRTTPLVVLTTANADAEVTTRSQRLGAAGLFVQPHDLEAVVSFCKAIAPP
jgi:CheY-like chemotaxis protein